MNIHTVTEAVRQAVVLATYVAENVADYAYITDDDKSEMDQNIETLRRMRDFIAPIAEVHDDAMDSDTARHIVGEVLKVSTAWVVIAQQVDLPYPEDGEVREAAERLEIIAKSV